MGHELVDVEPASATKRAASAWCCVHQAHADRDVVDPKVLQSQLHGLPCTPTLATRPPGRTICVAISNVAGTRQPLPQRPRPTVSQRHHFSFHSDWRADAVGGAELLGLLMRFASRSMAMILRHVQPCRHDHGKPDRPGADDGDDVTRLGLSVLHADLESGRQDVAQEHALLIGDALRYFVDGVSAYGTRTNSACVPSIRWPNTQRCQPPLPHRGNARRCPACRTGSGRTT